MNHRKKGRKLNRTAEHRKALLRNMTINLVRHGKITTTLPKAKAVRPFAEKLVTLAKQKTLHRYRQALARLHDENAVHKLFEEIGPHFAATGRPGGYTRIIRLPKVRLGDNAPLAILEWVDLAGKEAESEAPPETGAAPAEKRGGKKAKAGA